MNKTEKMIARSANGERPEAGNQPHSAGLDDPQRVLAGTDCTEDTVKVDLHCHSTASEAAKLGVQRALALPECATPPQEVYELAKRRGMDFVTITDHDTIAGALELADLPDVFVSEELTAWFRGEHQAVHVLCFGITPDDHEWLQAHSGDVFACADYLHGREIACALAHPFFHVAAPLTPAHRRVLAELFPVWETRNGARARELNAPAAVYIETHGGIAVGGSDDHAGVDIGRTYTEAAHADTPAELLAHIRAGRVRPHGKQGSAAKWAHSALVLAARSFAGAPGPGAPGPGAPGPGTPGPGAAPGATPGVAQDTNGPDPGAVLELAERIMIEGDARQGSVGSGLGPEDGRRLLRAWLNEMELGLDTADLVASMQAEDFSHSDLERRARRVHERKLTVAIDQLLASAGGDGFAPALTGLFAACLPAVPYVPASAFLAREQAKLVARDGDPIRVAVVADGVGAVHGVTHTLQQLRERGIRGHEIEVIGTDASVDRRLAAVSEIDLPFYAGLKLGVPSVFAVAEALTERRYDLVHVCAPGPAGIIAALIARVMGLPVAGSYHTELQMYARMRSADPRVEFVMRTVLAKFYSQCRVVLSPSRAADDSLRDLGIPAERLARWDRGVDLERFNPARYAPGVLPGDHSELGRRFNVLYVGRLSKEKGVDLLAEAFQIARDHDPRLHLVLAGRGPEEESLRRRLGSAATFLGWVGGDRLAQVYASADLFMFASTTDTFGQVILEAQASGLPVLAVDAGGPAELIEDGRSGCLVAPEPESLAGALRGLARRDAIRERLATGGLLAVGERLWSRSLDQLAGGYARALATGTEARTTTAASRDIPRSGVVARAA
ncbi:MAG TPA: glycosyltransferase [Solirubrobacteraceae bacterium]|jgi:glycosyltransferase involved in cell wall biosynthesis/predicted metal-dependent phosphoesterase TrpH|nr:glycosyltransferase [Solirubrobacteraceae bacterium]